MSEATSSNAKSKSTSAWKTKLEGAVNKQINEELTASYAYLTIAQFFTRHDVALPNVAKYFFKCSEEETEHAKWFIEYQNKRGGTVTFQDIKPVQASYNTENFNLQKAFEKALKLEKYVNECLLKLYDQGGDDPQFQDFVASTFLKEQVDAIDEIEGYVANIKKCCADSKLGEFIFDKNLLV